ncbi:uncharacterized protein LOC141829748 [Curcuma longa]|uniref:uncharacterized protein LOC141829748 n=1 Tax=Curcuma longa TaxID=136217 RepID=UPI003D9F9F83
MEPSLVGNFIRFVTAKQVWDSIATTFYDGSDLSQVYDLQRVSRMRQEGGSLEKYYNDLQGLWREIDFRRPNSMECARDIQKYNFIVQEERVYIFLDGLDERFDNIRSDVLELKLFPTIEQAYAFVRREDTHKSVLTSETNSNGAVMATKGIRAYQPHLVRNGSAAKSKGQPEGGKCSHCGSTRHTRDVCFKLYGYPDWWHELQAKKKQEKENFVGNTGCVAVAVAEPHLSLIPIKDPSALDGDGGNSGQALYISKKSSTCEWIIDSGATDHMTFDSSDFSKITPPRRTYVTNANGVAHPVTGAGTDILSKEIIGQ